jgi:hypothetical protein
LVKKSGIFGGQDIIEDTVHRFNMQRVSKNILKANYSPKLENPKNLIEKLLLAVD